MFQIDPILWLQSFESPSLTWLMTTVSLLGYTPVYGTLLICIIFGLRLRIGFSILLAFLITGLLIDGLKRGIKFPRPSHIDIRVIEPGRAPISPLLENGGGKNFWALPSAKALETVKIQPDWSYGFPSGHVASAATFFLGLAFFFRSRGLLAFSIIWVLLMALSRMYLGRHFIADVLGGIGVGIIAVIIAAVLLRSLNFEKIRHPTLPDFLPLAIFVIPLVFLVPFVDLLDNKDVGRLLGVLTTYIFMFKIGWPSDAGKLWKRIIRVLITLILFLGMNQINNRFMDSILWEETPIMNMITIFLTFSIAFIGAILIAMRLKLYTSLSP